MSEKITKEQYFREEQAMQLLEDFKLSDDSDYFSEPSNRLKFIEALEHEEFFSIAQHANARMRGFNPRAKSNLNDEGAFLPMLGTPAISEKPKALEAGFNVIKDYLKTTSDSDEQKLKGVGMAVEALIIWVHPFDDGNGRTSRFLGRFFEEGTADMKALVSETASNKVRLREYSGNLRVDQANVYKGQDLILDDQEIEEIQKTEMPIEDGISQSIERLLNDKTIQERVDKQTMRWREGRTRYLAEKAA